MKTENSLESRRVTWRVPLSWRATHPESRRVKHRRVKHSESWMDNCTIEELADLTLEGDPSESTPLESCKSESTEYVPMGHIWHDYANIGADNLLDVMIATEPDVGERTYLMILRCATPKSMTLSEYYTMPEKIERHAYEKLKYFEQKYQDTEDEGYLKIAERAYDYLIGGTSI